MPAGRVGPSAASSSRLMHSTHSFALTSLSKQKRNGHCGDVTSLISMQYLRLPSSPSPLEYVGLDQVGMAGWRGGVAMRWQIHWVGEADGGGGGGDGGCTVMVVMVEPGAALGPIGYWSKRSSKHFCFQSENALR